MQYVKEISETILHNGKIIGHMMIFLVLSNNYRDYDYAYIWDFEIYKPFRNKGYGTHALLEVVYKYGRVYIFPSNQNSERLYKRLGRMITFDECPDVLKTAYQECGAGYVIINRRKK